jgi:hypothetical protein
MDTQRPERVGVGTKRGAVGPLPHPAAAADADAAETQNLKKDLETTLKRQM